MIKCIYDQCQWPECDKTCGLVPTGDYAVGSCAEEGLIYYLQSELAKITTKASAVNVYLNRIKINANDAHDILVEPLYERTCPYGYHDCVYDPGYLRKYHKEDWIANGMPVSCGETCGGKSEGGYCNDYDWEDK